MKFPFTRFTILAAGLFCILDACSMQEHFVPALDNCRINTFSVQSKTSDLIYGEGIHTEIMEINGQQIKLANKGISEFKFDQKGLVVEANGIGRIFATTTMYQYLPGVFKIIINNDPVYTFPSNEQGYVVRPGYVYNAEGYLIQAGDETELIKYTYLDGNLAKEERFNNSNSISSLVFAYEYDALQPNLPDTETYTGKTSRNLPVKVTRTFYPSGLTLSWIYKYTYDEKGRVKQRIMIVGGGSSYEVDDYSYTYICQ